MDFSTCPHCNADVIRLADGTCPECGEPFDMTVERGVTPSDEEDQSILEGLFNELRSTGAEAEQEAGGGPVTAENLEEFIQNHYSLESPRAEEAIEVYLREVCHLLSDENRTLLNHFFATVMREDPEFLRTCERLLGKVSGSGFTTLLELLTLAGDDRTREALVTHRDRTHFREFREPMERALNGGFGTYQSVFDRPVRSPHDLDLLWAEFFATGNQAIVIKVIEILGWDDVVRARMDDWLQTEGKQQWAVLRRRRLRRLSDVAGILFDADGRRLENVDDLDTRCFLRGIHFARSRSMAVRRLLPFALSAEELNHIGVKVSAKWSLSENARRHPIVMEACSEEARSAATPVKLSLLEIQAAAHLAEMCTDEALEALDEYLGINPANRAIVRQRKDAASGVVRFPPPDPPEKSLSQRLEHPVTLAGGVIVLALLSSPAMPLFTRAFGSAPVASLASAVICFVLATLLGIGRQTSGLAYRRALTLDFDEITAGDDDKVGEETLFGCWTAPGALGGSPFPLGGCLWVVSGLLSLWAAGVAAAFLARSLNPREIVFAVVFGSMLVLRWAVSAVASRIIVWRWASSSKR